MSKGSLQGPEAPTPSWAAPSSSLTSCGPVPRKRPILTEKLSKKAEGSHSTYPHPAPNIQTKRQEKYFFKKGINSEECWDFPGGPVVGTLQGLGFDPWSGNSDPAGHAAQPLQDPLPALRSHPALLTVFRPRGPPGPSWCPATPTSRPPRVPSPPPCRLSGPLAQVCQTRRRRTADRHRAEAPVVVL